MQETSLSFTARRANYSTLAANIALLFLICMGPLALALWYIATYMEPPVNDRVLYLIILVPFIVFIYILRRRIRESVEQTACTVNEAGITEKPSADILEKRFIPWKDIISVRERLDRRLNAPYLQIRVRESTHPIIVHSHETGLEQYRSFLDLLRRHAGQ